MRISEKIIELRLATRKATMCENTGNYKKNTLNLKTKILFLLRNREMTPDEIISILLIAKPNLTILTSSMIEEGLINKEKKSTDKREISFSITQKGLSYLEKRLDYIDNIFDKVIDNEDTFNKISAEIDDLVNLISFI